MKKYLHPYILPLITGLYPILSLTAHNINEIKLEDTYRSFLLSFILTILIIIISSILFKDKSKAALIATFFLFFFFSYGHLYLAITNQDSIFSFLGRHRYLIAGWILAYFLVHYWVFQKLKSPNNLVSSLTFIMTILILMPSIQILTYTINNASSSEATFLEIDTTTIQDSSNKPDIYYIILDAYGRHDYLKDIFNYDNSPFLQSLEENGFYIANCSQTNYSQTKLSLATSLNINYLETFYDREIEGEIRETASINGYIENNLVRQTLKSYGYQIISLESGWGFTQYKDADYYFTKDAGFYSNGIFSQPLNQIEALFIQTSALTIIPILFPSQTSLLVPNTETPTYDHYERVLFTLDTLKIIPEIPGPKFVFAHIVSPHTPYIFDSNGNYSDEDLGFFTGYSNQAKYISLRVQDVIDEIIEKSPEPPIIIIQGDHGPLIWEESGVDARMSILNAYHLPAGGNELLYPSISPVNTFRVIFNHYFDGNYEMLEDIGYYSTYPSPQEYTINVDKNADCQ